MAGRPWETSSLNIMNASRSPSPNRITPDAAESSPSDRDGGSRRVRCRFAKGSDSGPGLTDEMSCLLRTRLRLAILIILSAFAVFFLRNLLLRGFTFDQRELWLLITGCE